MKRIELAEKLLDIGAVSLRGEENLFTWASGIKSPIYCDNRITMSFPEVRGLITEGFIELSKGLEYDVIAGTATAGIPHAAWLSGKLGKPMAYVRSSAKEHGRQNMIEGIISKGDKVLLIEDLFSTGGSSMSAVKALRQAGAEVVMVLGIFSYGFDSLEKLFADEEVSFRTITDYKTLLSVANARGMIDERELEILGRWSKEPRMFTE